MTFVPILEAGKRCGTKGDKRDGLGIGAPGDPMFTLQRGAQHAVAFGGNNTTGPIDKATACNAKGGSGRMDFESETFVTHSLRGEGFDASEDGTGRGTPLVPVVSQTITADMYRSGGATAGNNNQGVRNCFITPQMGVRRLTPIECARLQGFPDTYCHIPSKSKRKIHPDEARYLLSHGIECWQDKRGTWRTQTVADGPIYKALGNSFAVPVIRWIGRRIAAVEAST